MSRSVSIGAMNKISYFLTYHSFLFYISKLSDATVIFYILYSFSFSPRRRFVFQTEISGKYIVLLLISRLFYFLSSLRRGDQSTVFCIISFEFLTDPGLQRSGTLLQWFVVVVLPILEDCGISYQHVPRKVWDTFTMKVIGLCPNILFSHLFPAPPLL